MPDRATDEHEIEIVLFDSGITRGPYTQGFQPGLKLFGNFGGVIRSLNAKQQIG